MVDDDAAGTPSDDLGTAPDPTSVPSSGAGGAGQMVFIEALARGAGISIPRGDAEGFEGALAAANDCARTASLDRLATWFPGYDFAAAAQNVDDRRYTQLPVNETLLDQLNASEVIDRFVTQKDHFFGPTGVTFSRAE